MLSREPRWPTRLLVVVVSGLVRLLVWGLIWLWWWMLNLVRVLDVVAPVGKQRVIFVALIVRVGEWVVLFVGLKSITLFNRASTFLCIMTRHSTTFTNSSRLGTHSSYTNRLGRLSIGRLHIIELIM